MSRVPGSPKTGGRKKGTPNKNSKTQQLTERAKALDVDPYEILLLFAKGDWKALGYESAVVTKISGGTIIEEERIPPVLRLRAALEACLYLYSKKKPIESTIDFTAEEQMLIQLFRKRLEEHGPEQLSQDDTQDSEQDYSGSDLS